MPFGQGSLCIDPHHSLLHQPIALFLCPGCGFFIFAVDNDDINGRGRLVIHQLKRRITSLREFDHTIQQTHVKACKAFDQKP